VTPEHRLITAFQSKLRIEPPSAATDLLTICESIAAEQPSVPQIDPALGQALVDASGQSDNLHAVRRWIEWMLSHQTKGLVTADTLEKAMIQDLKWILPKIQYRGKTLTIQTYETWALQFPANIRTAAVQIVRDIADHYYIGTTKYFEALDDLIVRSGVIRKDAVVFCKWQHLGKSAPRVAHNIHNQGRWKVTGEIDLDGKESDWPKLTEHGCSWVIIADDFVGSGRTISQLVKSPSVIGRILAKYPLDQDSRAPGCRFRARSP
jgi:hypothetical protein